MGDVGGRLAEVRATEQRLGRQLPPSVREYVAYAYDVAALSKGGIARRDDFSTELKNGPAELTVLTSDGMIRWAIPDARLSEEDPPVSSYCAAFRDDIDPLPVEGTGPQEISLSHFVFATADDHKVDSGRFRTWMRDGRELRNEMDAFFPIKVAHHRTSYWAATTIVHTVSRNRGTLYEGAGILAWLTDSRVQGASDLHVWAHPTLTREAIPGFLWNYVRRDNYPEGIFRTEIEAELP